MQRIVDSGKEDIMQTANSVNSFMVCSFCFAMIAQSQLSSAMTCADLCCKTVYHAQCHHQMVKNESMEGLCIDCQEESKLTKQWGGRALNSLSIDDIVDSLQWTTTASASMNRAGEMYLRDNEVIGHDFDYFQDIDDDRGGDEPKQKVSNKETSLDKDLNSLFLCRTLRDAVKCNKDIKFKGTGALLFLDGPAGRTNHVFLNQGLRKNSRTVVNFCAETFVQLCEQKAEKEDDQLAVVFSDIRSFLKTPLTPAEETVPRYQLIYLDMCCGYNRTRSAMLRAVRRLDHGACVLAITFSQRGLSNRSVQYKQKYEEDLLLALQSVDRTGHLRINTTYRRNMAFVCVFVHPSLKVLRSSGSGKRFRPFAESVGETTTGILSVKRKHAAAV